MIKRKPNSSPLKIPSSTCRLLLVAYEIPPLVHDDFPALEAYSLAYLSVGDSSRLAKRLVDTGQGAAGGCLDILAYRGPGYFAFILFANMGVDLAVLEEASYEELKKIIDEGVPQEELDKVIAGIRSRNILGLETALGIG